MTLLIGATISPSFSRILFANCCSSPDPPDYLYVWALAREALIHFVHAVFGVEETCRDATAEKHISFSTPSHQRVLHLDEVYSADRSSGRRPPEPLVCARFDNSGGHHIPQDCPQKRYLLARRRNATFARVAFGWRCSDVGCRGNFSVLDLCRRRSRNIRISHSVPPSFCSRQLDGHIASNRH